MNTATRMRVYGPNPTARQRLVKKAGRDPGAVVVRDDGMGYPPAMQGYRELAFVSPESVAPVSGAPI
jgi:hypothetical protein